MENQLPQSLSLADIIGRLGGELIGDPGVQVSQVATLEEATPGTITFLANDRYLGQLKSTRAGAVIVGEQLRATLDMPHIIAANPYAYFARVSALLNPLPAVASGMHPSAVIHPRASIGSDVYVGPNVVIEDGVSIGAGFTLSQCHHLSRMRTGQASHCACRGGHWCRRIWHCHG